MLGKIVIYYICSSFVQLYKSYIDFNDGGRMTK